MRISSSDLIKEWMFSATEDRYICKKLGEHKEVEIDLDGSVYLHLNFNNCSRVQFSAIKKALDQLVSPDLDDCCTMRVFDNDCVEYYYEDHLNTDIDLIAYTKSTKNFVIQFQCLTNEFFESFLNYTPCITSVVPLVESYCIHDE
jgi:hypothetical protein